MAKTLLEEIINQLTGRNDKKFSRSNHCNHSCNHNHKPKRDYQYEKIKYDHEKALFENKKNVEIIKHIGRLKGWF